MTELEGLIEEYEKRFGVGIPEGRIDKATLIQLLKKALKDNELIRDASDFAD